MRDGCPVEVAVRLHPSVVHHRRVVDRRRQLPLRDQRRVADGVPDAAVDLRRAAQGVRVLHHPVAHPVAGHDRRPGEEPPQVRCRGRLPRMGTQCHQVGCEGAVGAELALDAHRSSEVSGVQQQFQVGERQHQHAQHAVGAVDQRQALLLRQHHGGEAVVGERLCCRALAAAVDDSALTDEHECAVGERCEVAGAAEAAVLVHHRHQPRVQQGRVGGDGGRPDAAVAAGEGGQPQQHHRAHHFVLDRGVRCRRRASGSGCAAAGCGRRRGCCGSPAPRSRWTPRRPHRRPRRGRRCGRGQPRRQPRPPVPARRGRPCGRRRRHRTG